MKNLLVCGALLATLLGTPFKTFAIEPNPNLPSEEDSKVITFHCKSTDDAAISKFNGMIQMTINNYSKITQAVLLVELQKSGNNAQKEIFTSTQLYGKFEVFPEGTLYNQEVTFYNLRDDKDLPSTETPFRGQITGDINHFLSSKISLGDWIYFSKCEK